MAATNHVEAGFLHHPHVSPHGLFGHGIAPTSLVLVDIRPPEEEMFPVKEKTFVGCPLEPPEAERHFFAVQ